MPQRPDDFGFGCVLPTLRSTRVVDASSTLRISRTGDPAMTRAVRIPALDPVARIWRLGREFTSFAHRCFRRAPEKPATMTPALLALPCRRIHDHC
jgi:hypothetical protein